GMTMRARRQLVVSVRREQSQLLDGARQAERRRIAREMHDTLAHRLSILSVHAGALAYRTETDPQNLDPAQVHEAVDVIQDSAQRALAELGEVLTLLRAEDGDIDDVLDGEASLATRLRELAEEARGIGQRVALTIDEPAALERLSPRVRRTVYRVVQEGLTNARKHAPGAAVTVRVVVDGRDLSVLVDNPVQPAPHRPDGFGLGLTGLHERVGVDGGSLSHGREDGRFRLAARIPA
ncbi:MAG: sensor histidine kinase, partial [Stackebrandtia sp.]